MESSNPFSGAVNRSRKERKLIDPGIYKGTLKEVKSLQVTDKKTQEKKTKVLFSFFVPEVDAEVVQFFNPSLADTSFIVKFLKTLAGAAFTPEIQASADKMWAFVKGLEGSDFNLVVTLTNGYNNVQSAMPIRAKPVEEQASVAFSDDDIPF